MAECKPSSEPDLAQALSECAEARRTIRLGGHFSKDALAGPVTADAAISTCAMRRVLQYDPRDLTISVEAGLPWAELTAVLAERNQMVALDPPWFDEGTVGGTIAANLSGPRRLLYGGPRDVVIGMRFVTLEGRTVQSGGMVVKNVAGLDMAKLMIGSWGTLAAISVVNFKVSPIPPETRTLLLEFKMATQAVRARDKILQSALQPAAMDILNPAASEAFGLGDHFALLIQAGGSPAVLERYSRELYSARKIDCEIWTRIREFVPKTKARRISTTLEGLEQVLESPAMVVARAGSGVAYIAGGVTTPAAEPSAMMEKVKDLFDPNRLLNPGRVHDGF